MAYTAKTWKDRQSEYPNRRNLTDADGNISQVTVSRDEGAIAEEGDAFSAENMNDMEQRISNEFSALSAILKEAFVISGTTLTIDLDKLGGA